MIFGRWSTNSHAWTSKEIAISIAHAVRTVLHNGGLYSTLELAEQIGCTRAQAVNAIMLLRRQGHVIKRFRGRYYAERSLRQALAKALKGTYRGFVLDTEQIAKRLRTPLSIVDAAVQSMKPFTVVQYSPSLGGFYLGTAYCIVEDESFDRQLPSELAHI